MKILFSLLLLPLFSLSQTVHIKDDKIEYQGKIQVGGLSATETYTRAQHALASLVKKHEELKDSAHLTNTIRSRGSIKLKSPHHIIRNVLYTIEVTATDGGYQYRIDSVSVKEQVRGKKAEIRSPKELLEVMEDGGVPAIAVEKILNEIDMRFQKLLALLRSKISS